MLLTKRWTKLKDHETQIQAYQSKKRFNVVPAGRRCLEKDTLVATPKGPVKIQDLKIGDDVIGYNEYGKPEITKVIKIYKNGVQDVQEIKHKNKVLLRGTKKHKLWCKVYPDKNVYKRIQIKDIYKNIELVQIKDNKRYYLRCVKGGIYKKETYDIQVNNKTNLYLLANGIVTSNSGKTEIIGKRKQALRFLLCHDKRFPHFYSSFDNPMFFIGAPTRDQVKRIYWSDIKSLVPTEFLAKPPNESNLILYGKNGAELHLLGLDKPERIEGSPWDYGVIDEIGNVKASAWPQNIRPALSDRKGGCDFIGVPEGRNHYYDLAKDAEHDTTGEWGYFHWLSADILDPQEIKSAKESLDDLVYQQEYEASFVNFTGMVYYRFNSKIHVGNYKQFYNPAKSLIICFDFNVAPGVAVICQELGADVFKIPPGKTITVVLDEVYIPLNSNTQRVCKKIIQDWKYHKGTILCYGDATGGAKGSAKVKGSDWDIIKDELMPYFGDRLFFNVPKINPRERQRVNAVNSRLQTKSGDIKLLIDKGCKKLIVDFEGVRVIEGGAGEIDKKSDTKLTHLTDSIGYYIHKEFPVFKYWSAEDINQAMQSI